MEMTQCLKSKVGALDLAWLLNCDEPHWLLLNLRVLSQNHIFLSPISYLPSLLMFTGVYIFYFRPPEFSIKKFGNRMLTEN